MLFLHGCTRGEDQVWLWKGVRVMFIGPLPQSLNSIISNIAHKHSLEMAKTIPNET